MDIAEFYDAHVEKVYKFFYIKTFDKAMAEELTADTFLRFLTQVKKKSVDDHTKYLYGIMRTAWIEFLKQKYRASIVAVDQLENFEEYSTKIITDFEESEGAINRLQPFVDRLPDKQRQVLIMRIYQERTVKETADALGKDSNYVKTTYQRAVKSLRVMVQNPFEEGVEV